MRSCLRFCELTSDQLLQPMWGLVSYIGFAKGLGCLYGLEWVFGVVLRLLGEVDTRFNDWFYVAGFLGLQRVDGLRVHGKFMSRDRATSNKKQCLASPRSFDYFCLEAEYPSPKTVNLLNHTRII